MSIPMEIKAGLVAELSVKAEDFGVYRRVEREQETLLVVAYPGCSLTDSDIPNTYRGYDVFFEKHTV